MRTVYLCIGALALLAGLVLAFYTLSPLVRTTTLDEASPDLGQDTPFDTEPTPVVETPAHPASGTARIVSADDTTYLRYEDFSTLNGPDLRVYLSKDLAAQEYVDLGPLRATEGNVNYEIPQEVDPREYPYALVWCRAFGVLFNSAQLY